MLKPDTTKENDPLALTIEDGLPQSEDTMQILTAYRTQNGCIHLGGDHRFDAETWGLWLVQFAWMLSANSKAFDVTCDAFNNRAQKFRKLGKN
jgi:hypothetical protein